MQPIANSLNSGASPPFDSIIALSRQLDRGGLFSRRPVGTSGKPCGHLGAEPSMAVGSVHPKCIPNLRGLLFRGRRAQCTSRTSCQSCLLGCVLHSETIEFSRSRSLFSSLLNGTSKEASSESSVEQQRSWHFVKTPHVGTRGRTHEMIPRRCLALPKDASIPRTRDKFHKCHG